MIILSILLRAKKTLTLGRDKIILKSTYLWFIKNVKSFSVKEYQGIKEGHCTSINRVHYYTVKVRGKKTRLKLGSRFLKKDIAFVKDIIEKHVAENLIL